MHSTLLLNPLALVTGREMKITGRNPKISRQSFEASTRIGASQGTFSPHSTEQIKVQNSHPLIANIPDPHFFMPN